MREEITKRGCDDFDQAATDRPTLLPSAGGRAEKARSACRKGGLNRVRRNTRHCTFIYKQVAGISPPVPLWPPERVSHNLLGRNMDFRVPLQTQ